MIFPYPLRNKAVTYWLLSGCLLIFCMVIIGGITRLTNSGLSMVQWNLLMGAIPPLNEQAWQEAFNQYKLYPEFQKLNQHFGLEDFRAIFWWEYTHRLLGRLTGLVFLLPFLWFWLRGKISRSLMPKLLLLFALGAFQGFLGWFMVKSGLTDKPYVSHYRLAIHLLMAFITFGYSLWLALQQGFGERKNYRPVSKIIYFLLLVFIGTLGLQLVYGALVAGLKAGYAYNTFPKMGPHWVPGEIHELTPFYQNVLEGQAGVQFIHRSLAYLLLLLAFSLFWQSRKTIMSRRKQTALQLLLPGVFLQALLGIFTLLLFVPLPLAVLHQAGAFGLLSISLFLLYYLKSVAQVAPSEEKANTLLKAKAVPLQV